MILIDSGFTSQRMAANGTGLTSTPCVFTFGGSSGIQSSISSSTILRGWKEILNGTSPLSDDNAFWKGI